MSFPGRTGLGVALAGGGALSAAAYIVAFRAATGESPAHTLVLPLLLASAVLATVVSGCTAACTAGPVFSRASLVAALQLGPLTALGSEAMARALASMGAGPAAVILRSQVLFVALGGWWVLGERVRPRFWIGVAAALAGLGLLHRGGGFAAHDLSGTSWALVASAAFAAMQVVVRGRATAIEPVHTNALRLWIAAALVVCLPGRAALLDELSPHAWWLVAAVACFGPVLSRLLLMFALRHIVAAECTLVTLLAPAAAFVMGATLLGEHPTSMQLLGSALLVAGVALPVLDHLPTRGPAVRIGS